MSFLLMWSVTTSLSRNFQRLGVAQKCRPVR
jgi:hypothetical protein